MNNKLINSDNNSILIKINFFNDYNNNIFNEIIKWNLLKKIKLIVNI